MRATVQSLSRSPAELVLRTRQPALLLIAFCALLWLPGFFTLPPVDRDEARFVQATRQMLETGDFIRIRNGEEDRNRKPIGIHWLQAPFAAAARGLGLAGSATVWPYRIPSVLGGLIAVLATYRLWRPMIGREAALLAAATLAAAPIVIVEARTAKTDAMLLGVTALGMGLLARAYLAPALFTRAQAALFWVAGAVAILLKGPIGPMVEGLTVLSLVIVDRRRGDTATWLRMLRPGWGVPLLLALVLPWVIAIQMATHGAFLAQSVGGDFAGKLTQGDDAHGALPGLHLLLLPVLLFPASIFVLQALPAAWAARGTPVTRFLLAWLIPAWIVFELVPTKLPHYPLPLYPALCLLAAPWVLSAARGFGPPWYERAGRHVFLAAGAIVGLFLGSVPFIVRTRLAWTDLLGALAFAVILGITWIVQRAVHRLGWERGALVALAAAPVLSWTVLEIEIPNLTSMWMSPRIDAALGAHWSNGRPANAAFGIAGFHEPSLVFLAGTDTKLLQTGWDAARFLAEHPDGVVGVADRDRAAFDEESQRLGLQARPFDAVAGFNYSRGRRTTVTLFTR